MKLVELEMEILIDKLGIKDVIGMIANICQQKAEHIRVNWQDEGLAENWEDTADRLYFSVSEW